LENSNRKVLCPPRQSMCLPRVSTSNKFAPLQGLNVEIASRKAPVLLAALMQVDPPLRISNRAVQLVSVPKQTTLSLAVLESSSLSTTVCLHATALAPVSVAWVRLCQWPGKSSIR